jgi:hypothetical protein
LFAYCCQKTRQTTHRNIFPTLCHQKNALTVVREMVKPLLALTLAACSSKSVVGFISAGSHSQRSLVVQDVLASNDDGKDSKRPLPPSLVPNPKQEAVLKAMGFMFDHKKRRWVRGIVHPGVSVVSCSERRLEVLDVDADDASEKPRSAVVDAASYLQEEIRTARENVVGSGQKQTSIPQKLAARRDGLYLWAGLQTLAFMLSAHVMVSKQWQQLILVPSTPVSSFSFATEVHNASYLDVKSFFAYF